MGFNRTYRPLVKVSILHHYFLDDGTKVFGDDLPEAKANEYLNKYRIADFLKIMPTNETDKKLRDYRSKFIQSNTGFQLATEVVSPLDANIPFISFPESLYFDFTCELTDSFFENYTDITINRDKVIFLSNKTPADFSDKTPAELEELGLDKVITIRFSKLSEFDSTSPMDDMDIDLNDFNQSELRGKLALIRIHLEGESGEISLTDGATSGEKKFNSTLPELQLMLKNRSTIWKYHRSSDGTELLSSVSAKPLTKNGYVTINDGSKDYPNPSVEIIYKGENGKYTDSGGAPVSEDPNSIYSRIFI